MGSRQLPSGARRRTGRNFSSPQVGFSVAISRMSLRCIANELQLKLTIQVSPRTVGKHLHRDGPVRTADPKQRWLLCPQPGSLRLLRCSPPPSGPTSSSSWRSDPAGFSTTTSRPIPRRSGRCSSSGKCCRATIPPASSSMIAIASSLRKSTRVSPTWVCEFCGRQCERRRRTRYASD
jgi:hypothetical protein